MNENIHFYLCITFITKAFYAKYINYLYFMYAPHSSLRLFYSKGLKDETEFPLHSPNFIPKDFILFQRLASMDEP